MEHLEHSFVWLRKLDILEITLETLWNY
jgi:hypothetical protein